MTSVGNFPGLENQSQYSGLILYLQSGEKSFITDHTSDKDDIRRLVLDASSCTATDYLKTKLKFFAEIKLFYIEMIGLKKLVR